jgi:hypothetical protein
MASPGGEVVLCVGISHEHFVQSTQRTRLQSRPFVRGINNTEAGCLCKQNSSGRPLTVEDDVERVRASFLHSPKKSTGTAVKEPSETTVWRFLLKRLLVINVYNHGEHYETPCILPSRRVFGNLLIQYFVTLFVWLLLLFHFLTRLVKWITTEDEAGTADGGTVVKVLRYKSEGRWFDYRLCHWNFSLT